MARPPRLRLPELVLREEAAPVSPDRRALLVDPEGTPVAFGWRDGDVHWLEVPDAATFAFRAGGAEILAVPAAGAGADAVRDGYLTLALPVALHVSGLEVLHASAVRGPAGAVAFCGLSGTGKTTTAYALSRRGHPLWGDDVVVLDPLADGQVVAHQVPFSANLRERTRAELGTGDGTAPAGAGGETLPLAAVVVLERVEEAGDAGIERLPAREALPALLPHGFRFDLSDVDLRRATVRRYLSVVAAAPVLRARFVPSFERLDAFLDELEAALALA